MTQIPTTASSMKKIKYLNPDSPSPEPTLAAVPALSGIIMRGRGWLSLCHNPPSSAIRITDLSESYVQNHVVIWAGHRNSPKVISYLYPVRQACSQWADQIFSSLPLLSSHSCLSFIYSLIHPFIKSSFRDACYVLVLHYVLESTREMRKGPCPQVAYNLMVPEV